MRPITLIAALSLVLVGATGCSDMRPWQQRTLSGAAIGAAAGAGIGYLAGGPLVGAAVGGVTGAAIGGLTSPEMSAHRQ